MPPETRAELIGGVVYMPGPFRISHGDFDSLVTTWLTLYRRATPGVPAPSNASVQLDDLDRLIATLEQGLATPDHTAFVARLADRRAHPGR